MTAFSIPAMGCAPERPPEAPLDPTRPVFLSLPAGEPLDLEHTFRCGQIFRWRQVGETWYGPYGEGSLAVRRVAGGVEVRALGVEVTAAAARRFLALDFPLQALYARVAADPLLAATTRALCGLRVLRQPPWDALAGFLCSQNSHIPKIERSMEAVARRWGRIRRWPEGVEVAAFPGPERLARLEPDALRDCALGYRAPYLVGTARCLLRGEVELPRLRELPYEAALAALLRLPGVGRKVADCALLFALDHPEAFPVDVWVRRVLREDYAEALAGVLPPWEADRRRGLSPREYELLVRFARERWGREAGWVQQYLFHARRTAAGGRA